MTFLFRLVAPVFASVFVSTVSAQPLERDDQFWGTLGMGAGQKVSASTLQELEKGGFEPFTRYAGSSRYGPLLDRVGIVDVKRADGSATACTATLISADLILTNAHCLELRGTGRVDDVLFVMGWLDITARGSSSRHAVDPVPLEYDTTLDFAVLKLRQPVTRPLKAWSMRPARNGEPLVLAGHPVGAPLHLSRLGCRLSDVSSQVDGYFGHHCSTLGGSSGSLILSDDEPSVVVGLHARGAPGVNWAIEINSIAEVSKLVSAAFGAQVIRPSRDVSYRGHTDREWDLSRKAHAQLSWLRRKEGRSELATNAAINKAAMEVARLLADGAYQTNTLHKAEMAAAQKHGVTYTCSGTTLAQKRNASIEDQFAARDSYIRVFHNGELCGGRYRKIGIGVAETAAGDALVYYMAGP